ncbi:hypothetical protein BB170200_00499 [Mycobacterium marinum]|nr:hypothetical protein BB170200_00499 [Mycobacterium marinum]
MLRGIDLPACADKDGPGRFVGYLQGADVDDDGVRLVERGLDDGIAQRRAVGGVDGASTERTTSESSLRVSMAKALGDFAVAFTGPAPASAS